MKVEWQNNRASVGPLELRVRQVRSSGEWCADAWVSLLLLSSESGFESDAEAREWCERFVKAFAVPIADAARAEGAAAERALLDVIDAEVSARIEAQRARLNGLDFEASTAFDIAHATGGVNVLEEFRRWVREQMAR